MTTASREHQSGYIPLRYVYYHHGPLDDQTKVKQPAKTPLNPTRIKSYHIDHISIASFLGRLLLSHSGTLDLRVLNSQAPDIQIITDIRDHINNEASMHTQCESQTGEHVRNLVVAIAEYTRDSKLWCPCVCCTEEDRKQEDVEVREGRQRQVRGDYEADLVREREADEEEEGDQVLLEDGGALGEPEGEERPGYDKGREAGESREYREALGAAGADDVLRAGRVSGGFLTFMAQSKD